MSTGATFDWTFPQAFAGNTAPIVDSTSVDPQGTLATAVDIQRPATELSRKSIETTEVAHQ